MHLPNLKCPEREQAIVDAVKRGEHTDIFWSVVRTTIPNHTATFIVMSDALMLDVSTTDRAGEPVDSAMFTRVNVTAVGEQAIADVLDCSLLTAQLADKIYERADITCDPYLMSGPDRNLNHMMDTTWMLEHSEGVADQFPESVDGIKLQNLPSDNERLAFDGKIDKMMFGGLLSTVGKHWIIEETLASKYKGCACNYGWHFPGSSCGGVKGETRVTSSGRLIQGRGYQHNNDHTDYSQTCQLVWNWCLIDGRLTRLQDLLQDTELAKLANHSGPMTYLRQL